MLFWGCKFKGEALTARQRPTPLGSALATQTKSANRRSLRLSRLHRPPRDAHREGGALARDAVHVNRRVMDYQRVFYDGEA